MDVLCLPVDGEGGVLVGMSISSSLCTFFSMWMFSAYLEMVRGILVGDENELLLMHLLQHEDVLYLPVDGEGDVLVGDENELLHGNLFQFVDVSIVKKANYGQRGNSEITWLRPGYYKFDLLFLQFRIQIFLGNAFAGFLFNVNISGISMF